MSLIGHILIAVIDNQKADGHDIELAVAGFDPLQTVLLLERTLTQAKQLYAERN